jgi:hypothetical protein
MLDIGLLAEELEPGIQGNPSKPFSELGGQNGRPSSIAGEFGAYMPNSQA